MGGFAAINNGIITGSVVNGNITTTYTVTTTHTLNLKKIPILEIPVQFYNGEYAKITFNTYFGFFAGVNNSTIEKGTVNGKHSIEYNLASNILSNLGRADSIINSYASIICGNNKGTIDNVIVYQRPSIIRNVPQSNLTGCNVIYEKGNKNELNEKSVNGYEYLINQNSGTIKNINIKYTR